MKNYNVKVKDKTEKGFSIYPIEEENDSRAQMRANLMFGSANVVDVTESEDPRLEIVIKKGNLYKSDKSDLIVRALGDYCEADEQFAGEVVSGSYHTKGEHSIEWNICRFSEYKLMTAQQFVESKGYVYNQDLLPLIFKLMKEYAEYISSFN